MTAAQREVLEAAVDRLFPPGEVPDEPGAGALGVVDYVDGLLDAFAVDPPRIFAGGPFSGRFGGEASFASFTPLTPLQERAWRQRIGDWQQAYRDGIAALGEDFASQTAEEQDARLDAAAAFKALLWEHTCEGLFGAPEYGGNRDLGGWRLLGYPGDVVPRGWTDEEVTNP